MGTFEALGDPTRRTILELLSAGERPVTELVESLQERGRISQPAVSQHLKVLREAGLVTARADGRRRLYGLNHAGLTDARAWLAHLVDPFASIEAPLDALATEVARGRRARRSAGPAAGRGASRTA